MSGRPTIVHLAVDVNTPQRAPTTRAVEWLVGELDMFDNVIVAMRRRPKPWALAHSPCARVGQARLYDLPFFGLPGGVGLFAAMWLSARRTIRLLERDGVRPDLVHAHKLTFEGIAGWIVARYFGVPLFVSLRGEVETKVFRIKPSYRPLLRRICRDAAQLYFVSAWFRDELHRHVPAQPDKERLLPNIVRNIAPVITPQPPGERFVAVFKLDTWRRKGLRWLLEGFAQALRTTPTLRLDIVGGGSAEARVRAQALIGELGLAAQVKLVGEMANAELLLRLPTYRALLLPSLNETFGMVYVEALFAGVPILWTKGTGIDGYLDRLDVGFAVPPKNPPAIAAAILDLNARAEALRANIAAAAPALFATFDPEALITRYVDDVHAALAKLETNGRRVQGRSA